MLSCTVMDYRAVLHISQLRCDPPGRELTLKVVFGSREFGSTWSISQLFLDSMFYSACVQLSAKVVTYVNYE